LIAVGLGLHAHMLHAELLFPFCACPGKEMHLFDNLRSAEREDIISKYEPYFPLKSSEPDAQYSFDATPNYLPEPSVSTSVSTSVSASVSTGAGRQVGKSLLSRCM
jgi:hypothetical protein